MISERFAAVPGNRVEPLGDGWVAYCPLSGETHLLNDEAAALLEVLDGGAMTLAQAASVLASDVGLAPESLLDPLGSAISSLRNAGLVRALPGP